MIIFAYLSLPVYQLVAYPWFVPGRRNDYQNLRAAIELAHQLRHFHANPQQHSHTDIFSSLLLQQSAFVADSYTNTRTPASGFEFPQDWGLESRRPLKKAVKDFLRLVSKAVEVGLPEVPTGLVPAMPIPNPPQRCDVPSAPTKEAYRSVTCNIIHKITYSAHQRDFHFQA